MSYTGWNLLDEVTSKVWFKQTQERRQVLYIYRLIKFVTKDLIECWNLKNYSRYLKHETTAISVTQRTTLKSIQMMMYITLQNMSALTQKYTILCTFNGQLNVYRGNIKEYSSLLSHRMYNLIHMCISSICIPH